MQHVPVMLNEVLEAVQQVNPAVVVDATFGGGGYTQAFLDSGIDEVLAIDLDGDAKKRCEILEASYSGRLKFFHGNYAQVDHAIAQNGYEKVDAIVADLGVSSYQLDDASKGFSFRHDGPLDMRMNSDSGQTAAEYIESVDESELVRILRVYGEEKFAGKIARTICEARKSKEIKTTKNLSDIIENCVPATYRYGRIHPATRSFQALRIVVNKELESVETLLDKAIACLNPGGILCVVTFHSLEDSIVKKYFREHSLYHVSGSRHIPMSSADAAKESLCFYDRISKKAVKPTDSEVESNSRARSAKMRWGIRSDRTALTSLGGVQ